MRLERIAAIALVSLAGASTAAEADVAQTCIGYSVTTPASGTVSGNPCLPGMFGHSVSGGNCQGIPPAGVRICVTFKVDVP